ncbi:MAG: 4-hydroxythreonine-4-phosphate dehydrogenase PdxA [Litorivicinaceae bacterium]
MNQSSVGVIVGDPNGIGPELIAKLLKNEANTDQSLVVFGDRHLFELGAHQAGISTAFLDASNIDYRPMETIAPDQVTLSQVTEIAGQSTLAQLDAVLRACQEGVVGGFIFGPFNKAAMHLAGLGHDDELHYMATKLGFDGYICELNVMDTLFTSRVTSHIALKEVASVINEERILEAIELAHAVLSRSGIPSPVISVCALNPHAGDGGNFGREEIDVIAPAVEKAKSQGIPVDGPWPSDTIFLRARDGRTNAVVTMYHDQGQIAMKLMGFDRGVTVQGGLPYPVTTPAHGTAFDIAGLGKADLGATKAAYDLVCTMVKGNKA